VGEPAHLNPPALYADEHLLVLDKPAGLLAVPGRGEDKQDCLSTRAQQVWPDALVVHRLDMATSGLMLMARSKHVQRSLSEAFAQRQVGKRYLAVVQGALQPDNEDWQAIDWPIALDWPHRPLSRVDAIHGKPSVTRWRRAAPSSAWQAFATHPHAQSQPVTRLELEPLTGRSHQLRVHLQALGHPIVGDALYGNPEAGAWSTRLLLHAWKLAFVHPVRGNLMEFESPSQL
jgi:tRNA pseudouridine32 synthase/23S rRNA pseudouridine746 synthase